MKGEVLMDGLLNFSLAFVLVAFAVVVLLGKADWLMAKYKLAFRERRLVFVKIREYDAPRTRPLFALMFFVIALLLVAEYVFRPMPEWCALIPLAVIVPLLLYVELKCRKK